MSDPLAIVPVRFDDAVAAGLALALDDLVIELTRFARAAELHARVAGHDWSGYTRRWFDGQLQALVEQARRAGGMADDERAAVERARAWATAEQQRRVDEAAAAAAAEEARLAELAALAALAGPPAS